MTTPETLQRAFTPDLELVRGGDGRTLVGIAVPFNDNAYVIDDGIAYYESFKYGAFAKTINERSKVLFNNQHPRHGGLLLGRAMLLREDTAGLYGEFHISKTSDGDDAIELIRDGVLTSLSVGFIPIRPARNARITPDTHVERTEVALHEVSLVPFAAYENANVLALRQQEEQHEPQTPHLNKWRRLYRNTN